MGGDDQMTAAPEPRSDHLAVNRIERVLVCTFDRTPVINASSPEMLSTWYRTVLAAADDDSVGAVVTANSGRAWNAGADMDLLLRHQPRLGWPAGGLDDLAWELLSGERRTEPDPAWDALGLNNLARDLAEYPKPLVASIDGAVAGGGVALALLHDVRFVSAATTFRTSFAGLGLVSELGLGYQLPRMVGTGRALDLCMSGRPVGAEEAVSIGLAERLVDAPVVDHATSYAAELARQPAASLSAIRRLVRVESAGPWADYLAAEWPVQRQAFDSDTARASVADAAERFGFDLPGGR